MRTFTAIAAVTLLASAAGAQHVRTLESARLFTDAAPVSINLALGAGTLNVAAADAPYLYRSITRFGDAVTAPTSTWNAAQRRLTFASGQRIGAPATRDDDDARPDATQDWRIQLTRRAPMDLMIDATAADATLDLTGIPLRRFTLRSGAAAAAVRFDAQNPETMSVFEAHVGAGGLNLIGVGNTGAAETRFEGSVGDLTLDLGGRWQRDMQISIWSGVGSVRINAPPTIGIELTAGGLLARKDVRGDFTRNGSVWRSSGYETAAVKVRILVKSMLGSVTLTQR